jgi:hypothetical protein
VLPLHAVWREVAEGHLQAAPIVNPRMQRTIAMTTAKSKGPPRAVSAVAALIVDIVHQMAGEGMWRTISDTKNPDAKLQPSAGSVTT